MKTHNIKGIFYTCALGLFLSFYLTSCSLDEYNPSAVSPENVLKNFSGWKSYQANCYTGLWGSLIGLNYNIQSETGTDLWTFSYGVHSMFKDMMAYEQFTTSSGPANAVWGYAYGSIKDCNVTLQLSSKLVDG